MNDLYIMHYGVGHDKGGHSGRYPWGSGKNPTYPTRYYGGVDTQISNKDYFKPGKGMFSIEAQQRALLSAKKYMKKTGKFITEDEMRYMYTKGANDLAGLQLLAAGAGYALPLTSIDTYNKSKKEIKALGKEWMKQHKYLDKYII